MSVITFYVLCCSVNGSVCIVCCVSDSVCELFGETIRNKFGCGCYCIVGGEVMYFRCFCFRGKLGFMNCYDICMCVINRPSELLEFVFDSVYVDLQYDEISPTFTAGSV